MEEEERQQFQPRGTSAVDAVRAIDPNDIIGPAAYGPQNFVGTGAPLAYTIEFENAATATAPAQSITVTQQLDPSLDWRTFRLTGFGFDNLSTTLSGGQAFYSALLDYSATKGYDVQVTAGVNVATGLVTWTFQTIDPTTGQAPADPQLGLLPVDDDAQDGEGFVSYTIKARSAAQTGAIVSAQATITFDTNAPITTPTVADTVDGTAPASAVDPLPAHTYDTSFDVSWSGTDDTAGSGIADYTILVSDDGATPTVWLNDTIRTNAIFQGDYGHTYAFSSIAADNAGNIEGLHAVADTEASVVACYVRGTLIRTPAGDAPIENLCIGDIVSTYGGLARANSLDRPTQLQRPLRRPQPERIAGAHPRRSPRRRHSAAQPLCVTLARDVCRRPPDPGNRPSQRCLYCPSKGCRSRRLLTHRVSKHDVVFAEGAPSESFIDDGSRQMFHNAADYRALYPDVVQSEPCYCARRLSDGYEFEVVRQRINARATSQPAFRGDFAA